MTITDTYLDAVGGPRARAAYLAAHPLADLSVLDVFAQTKMLALGADPNRRLFYSPIDDLHGVLKYVLASATRSIVCAMFGLDDDELVAIMLDKLNDENVYVQLTLDSSQSKGVHESKILAHDKFPNSSIAVGKSEKGAIMHLKSVVVDAAVVVHGSTNWSNSGESTQDNELVVVKDPIEAAHVTTRVAAIHTHMLNATTDA